MLALIWKELLQFGRDRALFLLVLWGFTGLIYMDTRAMDIEVKRIPTAIYDLDRTPQSRDLADRFRQPYFTRLPDVAGEEEIVSLLDSGRAILVLVIPSGFARRLGEGTGASVQALVDGTISNGAMVALGYVDEITSRYGGDRQGGAAAGVEVRSRVRFNPNLSSDYFVSLSELFTVLTMIAMLLPAAAMVREREYGTAEQLLATPLTPAQILLAKILPMTAVAVVGALLALWLVVQGIFAVPFRGSLSLFLLVTALFVFTTSGLGLALAAMCRTLAETVLLILLTLVPILFLSGSWTPIEAMPRWMQVLTYLSPLRYYLDLAFGIALKGAGIAVLWDRLLGLSLLGGALFGIGALSFRRSFA